MRQYGRARRFLECRLDGDSREAGGTEIASRQGRSPRQVADGMKLERGRTVTPPLAPSHEEKYNGNNGGTWESGSPDKLVRSVEAKGL